jgi:ribosomal protein S12 methylthiotransferase
MKKTNNGKVAVITLGCSKNLVDSEQLIGLLEANDFTYSENYKKSDVLIINTCGFIKPAKEESVSVILDAAEMRKKGKLKKVIVTGCLSERYSKELSEQIEGVDHFFGVNSYKDIIKALAKEAKFELLGERHILTPTHTAYVKISEGCNHLCAFCAIPLIRGRYVSRQADDIVREVESLVGKGVREFNVIAQDTTYYGVDLDGKKHLANLLRRMSEVEGAEWIRLLYTYPAGFPDDVLQVIAERPNICKYIDIPLQHISDNLLKSMRRAVTGKQIRELVGKIRSSVPGVAIRSAFIVGYPGETDKEFMELYKFIESARLDRVGVFTYSHEENTPAFELGDTVPEHIKEERRNALMELQQGISLKRNKKFVGSELKVIIDGRDEKYFVGRTEHDAPEVDNSIFVSTKSELKAGDIINVKVKRAEEYDLFGAQV